MIPDAPRTYRFRTEDAALRCRDTLLLHQTVLSFDEILAGRYVAIRLSDGGSDGVAYESRPDAIAHQKHNASRCVYLRVPLERLNAQACDVLLMYARACYDNGYRADPAHQLIIPSQMEHLT